jgi:hypothetical protein
MIFGLFLPSNHNWIGLASFFCFALLSVLFKEKIFIILFFSIIFSVTTFYIGSRGVTLMFLCFFLAFSTGRLLSKNLVNYLGLFFLLSMPVIFIFGASFYGTVGYSLLQRLSISYFNRNLDSDRLVRWNGALSKIYEKPYFGWGVDATLPRISNITEHAAIHNFWGDVLLRQGWVAVFLMLMFYMTIWYKFRSGNVVFMSILIPLLLSGQFYSLGAYTHLPGTFFLYVFLGFFLRLTLVSKKKYYY